MHESVFAARKRAIEGEEEINLMMRQVINNLLNQTRREYSEKQRLLALGLEAIVFLIALPYALIRLGLIIDQWLGFPAVLPQQIRVILGGFLMLGSWLFAIWSIYVQFAIGKGTPVPLMATQKLIVQPPYAYCRNPMALGAIGLYLGFAVLFGSVGALILVLLGAGCLLTYIKLVEEKEMEMRFGQEYLSYRKRTPFLFPRFRSE
jgi:protein-S-isoprenylcysteine O-methyltransferase Ste14